MKKTAENVMTAEIATTEISLNESQVIENKGEIEMTNENTNNTEITAIETVDTVNAENVIEEKKTSQKTKKSNAEKIAN